MKKLRFPFGEMSHSVTVKPDDMGETARGKLSRVEEILGEMPAYACHPSCNQCCHGSILMSYVEYVHILLSLLKRLGNKGLCDFFETRLGVFEDEGKLLCPFVRDDKEAEHCAIYPFRPLICRIFGTTASPCDEEIKYPPYPESRFFRAYNHLYYEEDGSFIGLPLSEGLALYEAPFDVWAMADSGETDTLMALFEEHGSMRAVICDLEENRFFVTLPGGGRKYLDE